jgi:cold shock protein
MSVATPTFQSGSASAGSAERFTGRVKWFNGKAGYGFITASVRGEEQDVFVHHSGIKPSVEQYRYLVQGEYVSFMLSKAEDGEKTIAVDVHGADGGKLMCETRYERRRERVLHPGASSEAGSSSRPQSSGRGRGSGRGGVTSRGRGGRGFERVAGTHPSRPQLSETDQEEWVVVRRRTQPSQSQPQPSTRGVPRGRGRGRPVGSRVD